MSRQVSPATERAYGLERVTRIWGVSRAWTCPLGVEEWDQNVMQP